MEYNARDQQILMETMCSKDRASLDALMITSIPLAVRD